MYTCSIMLFAGLEILIDDRSLYSKYIFKQLTIEIFQRGISRQKHSVAELSGFQVVSSTLIGTASLYLFF